MWKKKKKKPNSDLFCVTKILSLTFSQTQARKICCTDATSRLGECTGDILSRQCPPWVDHQWEQQLTLNSVTAVNCGAAQAKRCKCYANCKSRQCPALIIHQALQRGKSAVGSHFRVFGVCLKLRWVKSSQRRCQHGVRTLACCHFRAVQTLMLTRNTAYCFTVLLLSSFSSLISEGCVWMGHLHRVSIVTLLVQKN